MFANYDDTQLLAHAYREKPQDELVQALCKALEERGDEVDRLGEMAVADAAQIRALDEKLARVNAELTGLMQTARVTSVGELLDFIQRHVDDGK